ncbi:MAG: hypothetical protein ACTSPB_12190 [Candidatus Thorarchaeota archaeon]
MTTINTLKPEKQLYVRIFPCSITPNEFVTNNLNRVAKVTAVPTASSKSELGYDLVFIELDGEPKVIDKKDIEFITEKEYFQGKLSHG